MSKCRGKSNGEIFLTPPRKIPTIKRRLSLKFPFFRGGGVHARANDNYSFNAELGFRSRDLDFSSPLPNPLPRVGQPEIISPSPLNAGTGKISPRFEWRGRRKSPVSASTSVSLPPRTNATNLSHVNIMQSDCSPLIHFPSFSAFPVTRIKHALEDFAEGTPRTRFV